MRRVHVFVLYHPHEKGKRLAHSLGLDKGLVALVQAFGSIEQDQQNNLVIGQKTAAEGNQLAEMNAASGQHCGRLLFTG